MTYRDEILTHNPYFYLEFSDPTGTLAQDSSGNGRHGLYVGTYDLTASAIINSGSSVSLNNGSVIIPSQSLGTFPFNSWSIEFWVDSNSPRFDDDHLFSYYVSGTGPVMRLDRDYLSSKSNQYYRLRFLDQTFYFYDGSDPRDTFRQHIVITWVTHSIQSSLNLNMFCQGLHVHSGTVETNVPIPSSGSFAIGQEQNAQSVTGSFVTNNNYDARFDEFAMYPIVLSSESIDRHFISGWASTAGVSREVPLGLATASYMAGNITTNIIVPAATPLYRGFLSGSFVYDKSKQNLIILGATDIIIAEYN